MKKKLHFIFTLLLILTATVICFIPTFYKFPQNTGVYTPIGDGLTVNFLDVGKADAIYVNADGYNILIDGGFSYDAEEITTYLDRYSVDEIHMIVATHPDSDHIGGLSTVIEKYKVEKYVAFNIEDEYNSNSEIYTALLNTLKENNIDITYTVAGDVFTYGKMKFDVISPDHEYEDTNDDSVVLKLTYGENKFLFTGDASAKVEEYLIETKVDLDCDVLKVSHHGSSSATTEDFLKSVDPDVAVLSVDENTNNLPNLEVVTRLEDYPLKLYRTDNNGTVVIKSDGKEISVETEK